MFEQLAEQKLRAALKENKAVGMYGYVDGNNKVKTIYAKKSPYAQLQQANDYNAELILLIKDLKNELINLQTELSLHKK